VAGDGIANSSTARVKIGNNAPTVAGDGPYTAFLNLPLSVPAAQGVMANDSDPDGDVLTARLVTGTTNGVISFHSDGSFTYVPSPGYSGNDTFVYVANDGVVDSQPQAVVIGVYGSLHVT